MRHILVVDDSQETRDLVQMIFSSVKDIQVDFASSSSEAIDLFNANSYNACVLDVSLPDITGYYLGQLIREVCEEMPIAFLTNYEGSYTKENAQIINAHFWGKSEVFANPMQLVPMIREIAQDVDCSGIGSIDKPEVLKQLN